MINIVKGNNFYLHVHFVLRSDKTKEAIFDGFWESSAELNFVNSYGRRYKANIELEGGSYYYIGNAEVKLLCGSYDFEISVNIGGVKKRAYVKNVANICQSDQESITTPDTVYKNIDCYNINDISI